MKSYKYVGSEDLLELTKEIEKGCVINTAKDVLNWIRETNQQLNIENQVIATFIINLDGKLLMADRHSEHVVCAGGENVLSAGEITFSIESPMVEVVRVTNQSTGYCPEPESWPAVEKALEIAGLNPPTAFNRQFIFRKCISCGGINIVKDKWYVCMECDTDLPLEYNFG